METSFDSPFLEAAGRQGAFRVDPIEGDASSRRYARIVLGDGTSVILVQYPADQIDMLERDIIANRWLAQRGVPTPEVFEFNPNQGWALLRDFGPSDAAAELASIEPNRRIEIATRLIGPLVNLAALPVTDLPAWAGRLDEQRLRWELAGFELWFVRALCGRPIEAQLSCWLDDLAVKVASGPQRICHRDYHLNNLYLLGNSEVGVIDAQDLLQGPDTYDAASLLEERDMPELLSSEHRARWLEGWAVRTNAVEGWRERYMHTRIQRALKVIGTFSRLMIGGRDRYQPWLAEVVRRAAAPLESVGAPGALMATLLDWTDTGGFDAR